MARCAATNTFRSLSLETSLYKGPKVQAAEDRACFSHNICRDFLPRNKLTEELQEHFAEASQYASWARCILYGRAGSGKRQLATNFAIKYGKQSGRKVLWVDCEENESFVRDYRRAYHTLSGIQVVSSSPHGLSLHYCLCKIRRTLEERHDEWLLVLFDVNRTFENSRLADYLPKRRGQILFTTSSFPEDMLEASFNEETTWLGVKLDHSLTVRVGNLEQHEVHQYYEIACGGSKDDLEDIDYNKLFGLGFPRLALTFAHMRWLKMDPRTYSSHFGPQLRKIKDTNRITTVPVGTSLRFPETMQFIWQTLTNFDNIAIRLTVYISFFGPRNIPWHLLQQIRELQQFDPSYLYESLRLLAALGLVTVNTRKDGEEDINVHNVVHQWLRNKTRNIHDGDGEYMESMIQVIEAIISYFTLEKVNHNREKVWEIIGHLPPLFRICSKYRLETYSWAAFLSHVAFFLLNECAFVDKAEDLINRAIGTATRTVALVENDTLDRDYLGHSLTFMRETRVRILLYLSRPKEARMELARAYAQIPTVSIGENEQMLMKQRMRVLEVEACFLESDDMAAIGILKEDLKLSTLTEFEMAKLHHWMAKLMIVSGFLVPALRHSHMALSYWDRSADKWKQTEMLRWVDWHATILTRAGKFKAAFMILPNLLDQYLSTLGPTAEEVWRVAYGLGKTESSMKDHEGLVIRMLTAVIVEDRALSGNAITYCLMMLHEFGCRLFSRGRLVEAEGVFRHNISTAFTRQPRDLGSDGVYNYARDRLMLVDCLYEQGRRKEARNMRIIFKTKQGFNDNMVKFLRDSWRGHQKVRRAYYEALNVFKTNRADKILTCSLENLKDALSRYGCLENRLHSNSGPKFDIDDTGVGMARKSQVLHLLEYDFVYFAFSNRHGNDETLWVPEGQTVLGQYFAFCECRRHRKRSGSLNPVDLTQAKFLQEAAKRDSKSAVQTKQSSITPWLRHSTYGSPRQYTGELLSDQEREVLAEKANKLPVFDSSCAESDHCLSKFTWPEKKQMTPEYWTESDPVYHDPKTGSLTWEPFFLQQSDHEWDQEQLAVTNSINIPSICVTGADGTSAGPEIHISRKKWQMRITSYFTKRTVKFWNHPVDPALKTIKEEEEAIL